MKDIFFVKIKVATKALQMFARQKQQSILILREKSRKLFLLMIAVSQPSVFVKLISKEVIRYHRVFGLHNKLKSKEQVIKELHEVVLKEHLVRDSSAKLQWAYDYLLKCIKNLEDEALNVYNSTVRDGDNSMLA